MTEQQLHVEDFDSIRQESFAQLSAKDLQGKRFQPRSHNNNDKNKKKAPLRMQVSKPPKNAVKIKPTVIPVHFKWALILTILCFFLIGPCWALYKTSELRRRIQRQEVEAATRLSHKITTVLIFSTVVGAFAWVGILFCSVGILISGALLNGRLI